MVLIQRNNIAAVMLLALMILLLGASHHAGLYPDKAKRKVERLLEQQWPDKNIVINSIPVRDSILSRYYLHPISLVQLQSGNDKLGYLYVGKVYCCRQGGCDSWHPPDAGSGVSFEFFEYYMLLSADIKVIQTAVYNYQASYGYEITSEAWLRQFNDYRGSSSLVYNKDIQGISGATISGMAMTYEVEQVLRFLKEQLRYTSHTPSVRDKLYGPFIGLNFLVLQH
jgi:hypothetical protein